MVLKEISLIVKKKRLKMLFISVYTSRAAKKFFTLKGHVPTRAPFWSDKRKIWSDIHTEVY